MTNRLFVLFVMLLLPGIASSQNFNKVIEIVGGLEETMKDLIAKEELSRKTDIAALRSDITSLKTALFKEDTLKSDHLLIASTDAQDVLDRLVVLEQRYTSTAQPNDISSLTGQLDQLVDELRKVVEEGKAVQQKQLTLAPPPLYSITGQFRHRGELDGRSFVPEARTLGYSLLRSRINIAIAPAADTKIFLQVQDSRVFGAGNPALNRGVQDGMSKSIDFHQAYVSLSNVLAFPLNVKLGRQEIAYGKQRLFSAGGWGNFGNAFDALSVQYTSGPATVDGFIAKLVGSQTSTSGENIGGLFSTIKYVETHSADLFVFYDNNTTPLSKGLDKGKSRLDRTSMGVNFMGKPKPFDYDAELIVQRGSYAVTDSSSRSSISAYLYAVSAGYTIVPESKLRVGLKFQVMSGDDNQKAGTFATYNTLFSSSHSFFGFMDYFPKTTPEYGVRAFSLHASMDVAASTGVTFDSYYFLYDAVPTIKTSSGAVVREQSLGYETDVTFQHKYNSFIVFNGGVSAFLPNAAMSALKGPGVSYWTYFMTTVSF